MEPGYSGTDTAKIVGITYRQLDYWARTNLIKPSLEEARGSGSRRRYSYRDLLELRIGVENRPGTVAEIALALGHAQVNIEDMALYPAPDMRTGAISVWVAGVAEAERAGRMGVALSIRGRLRDLGGSAEVSSVPGQGTEVELRVPRSREAAVDGATPRAEGSGR